MTANLHPSLVLFRHTGRIDATNMQLEDKERFARAENKDSYPSKYIGPDHRLLNETKESTIFF